MAKFQKLNSALDRMHARLDDLEAQGVDITKLAKPEGRNLVRECLEKETKNLERRRAAACKVAASFVLGQRVRTMRGEEGRVVTIEGRNISVEIGDTVRKFAATTLKAA